VVVELRTRAAVDSTGPYVTSPGTRLWYARDIDIHTHTHTHPHIHTHARTPPRLRQARARQEKRGRRQQQRLQRKLERSHADAKVGWLVWLVGWLAVKPNYSSVVELF
jgi:hypothetical protein